MNTWISRSWAWIVLPILLAGCSDFEPFELFQGGGGSEQGSVAVIEDTKLAGGAVHLVAPAGYCIDEESLSRNFALMARCDTMGAFSGDTELPLALITFSVVPADLETPITTRHLVSGEETVVERREEGELTFVHMSGDAPAPGLSETYWRAAGRLPGYIVGMAVYAPEDETPPADVPPELMRTMFAETERRTGTTAAPVVSQKPKQSGKSIRELFGQFVSRKPSR